MGAEGLATERSRGARLGWALAIAAGLLAAAWALLPGQFADPFLRHDDYPVTVGQADLYWWKTLAKGRWLTWAFALRPWPTAPATVFALYMALWCLAAAFVGVGVFRGDRWPVRAGLLAAAVAAMPQAAFISGWPGATLPAVACLAGVAGVAALGSGRAMRGALAGLTALALMAHTAAALLLLLVALGAGPRGRTGATLAAFGLGLALGLGAMLGLNWAVHGAPRLETASWLAERPAEDLAGLVANLRLAAEAAVAAWGRMALGTGPVALGLAALAALAAATLWRRDVGALAALALGGAAALALAAAPTVLDGVVPPTRATGHLWLWPALALALAARAAPPAQGAVFAGALAVMAAMGAVYWPAVLERAPAEYRAATRALADRIAAEEGAERLLIAGQVHGMAEAAFLQSGTGLAFRLARLTGLETHLCAPQTQDIATDPGEGHDLDRAHYAPWAAYYRRAAEACAPHRRALDRLPAYPASGAVGPIAPGVVGLRLPERRIADFPP